ncbi:hypothetical protein Tco_0103363 [Tanacetum coccineum]
MFGASRIYDVYLGCRNVANLTIIICEQFQPMALPHVQLFWLKDMLKAFMVASSSSPFVFAIPGQMTHLVASLTLDSASISPDGFLPSIMLLLVIIVAVAIVVVTVVLVVVVIEGYGNGFLQSLRL